MSDDLFSLKMRAARGEKHISGAERIVGVRDLVPTFSALLDRGLHHANGAPDLVNFKVEPLDSADILHLDALPVRSVECASPEAGLAEMAKLLDSIGIARAPEIVELLRRTRGMRGAILLDADTLEHFEPDPARGVRATRMDSAGNPARSAAKNHFAEAIVLATKVAHAPGMVAELCISDDPDYVTGYIASQTLGYVRITPLKRMGDPAGGRIFLFRGGGPTAEKTIEFLEKQPVLVHLPEPAAVPGARLERIRAALDDLRARHLFRIEEAHTAAPAPVLHEASGKLRLFASNDYLDLARDPRLAEAACAATRRYGTGTGGARLATGTLAVHRELEDALARFKGTEEAVLFNTGFAANSGILPALCGAGDAIFSDELNHASIIDGCRTSRARTVVYRHNDMADLEEKIRATPCRAGLIVSDAVFSMDGDAANLPEIMRIAAQYDLFTMIDEAHSTGVLGATGHGIMEHFGNRTATPDILMGTLGKALGAAGAFAACSRDMADFLRNRVRSYIFSTSLPAGTAAAALAGLRILEEEPERVEALRRNVRILLAELARHGVAAKTDSGIVPIVLGSSERALRAAAFLRERGFLVSAIRYPSVAENAARLRIAVMSAHREADLAELAAAVTEAVR